MSRNLRIYYYTILGAIGGLIAWRLTDTVGFVNQANVYVSDLIRGALTGLSIGFAIGLAEAILSQSLIRSLRATLISGAIGLLAGALALPLAEFAFLAIGNETLGRALGWGLFGALIGLADGVSSRNQMWKSALGGFIGGVVGGILLELALHQLSNPLLGNIVGLTLLGAAIGAFTALIVVALSRAWLEVASGKLKGTEFILDKFMRLDSHAAIIGNNVLKSDIALPDPDVAPQHAQLKGAGSHFTLQDMSVKNGTFVNGRRVELHRLNNQEKIRLGSTELVYHERR